MLQPSRCGEGGHAGGLEGPKPPGATCPGPGGARAPALQAGVARGGRWLGGGRSPWRHPSAHMATGGVWNLLQVLFALFAHGHRRRKPSAPGAFWTVLLMEQVAKATCILCKKLQRTRGGTWRFPRVSRAKSGILWLSGGTTRVRWYGACYPSPSMLGTGLARTGTNTGTLRERLLRLLLRVWRGTL